jgi:predicted PhzF superfamily epimerase YddE/YHI9
VVLDFPAEEPASVAPDPAIVAALGVPVTEMLHATDLIAVTAPSDLPGVDFVSRWFDARAGVREDPVTGSAHVQLAPYWAQRLGRTSSRAGSCPGAEGVLMTDGGGQQVSSRKTSRR